jgi:ubiquinone/menaquinone biosynthesis C-methylase UbiE
MTPEYDLATQLLSTWERMAPGWEQRSTTTLKASEHVGRQLVEAASPRPGETVLELAAGPGETGFLAWELIQPSGRLISSDFSPAMVEVARRRSRVLGLTDVEFRVLDAQELELPDGAVDVVLCRWAYMLMPDPARALDETRRVLRPGGRLAFSVWGAPDRNPWATVVAHLLIEAGHMTPPGEGAPGIFALSDPRKLQNLVVEEGFEPPAITEVAMTWPFESFDDYWAFTLDLAGALSMILAKLPDEEQAAIKDAAREALGQGTADSLELEGLCLNVSTRVAG